MKDIESNKDYFYQTIRIIILANFICFAPFETILVKISFGFLLYFILMNIFCLFMQKFYKCERVGLVDENFLFDDDKNLANIVGVFFFDQYDYESMKHFLITKTAGLHRCRSKLVKIFGLWWFKEMNKEEYNSKKD